MKSPKEILDLIERNCSNPDHHLYRKGRKAFCPTCKPALKDWKSGLTPQGERIPFPGVYPVEKVITLHFLNRETRKTAVLIIDAPSGFDLHAAVEDLHSLRELAGQEILLESIEAMDFSSQPNKEQT